jgi:hypothetical protein
MARVRTANFHDARLSVAQSMIRDLIARHSPGAPAAGVNAEAPGTQAPGLKADHPLMQAANHVLHQVSLGHVAEAHVALVAYTAFRAAQTGVEMTLGTVADAALRCIELGTRYVLAWVLDEQDKMNEIRSEWVDNDCDLVGWASALEEWRQYYQAQGQLPQYMPPQNAAGQDTPPYVTPAPFALPPSTNGTLRVGVLGDWGTGEDEAFAVLEQLMAQSPDVIIHVGDVYYSGTAAEQNGHLLMPLQSARAKRNIPVYVLPGNHDYYSGGAGFYGVLPQLNAGVPNASVQAHSFWALTNEWWQLQGMDTGYNDSDLLTVGADNTQLRPDEAQWHTQQLAAAGTRTVILFSHHQLYSNFEPIGGAWRNPHLEANLQSWRQVTPNVVAWFWGHEHVLEVYEVPGSPDEQSTPPLPIRGRCVGNSAFPVFTDQGYVPGTNTGVAPLQAPQSPGGIPFPGGFVQSQADDQVWASGYMTLDLADGGAATATYYQVMFRGDVSSATSQVLWTETIPAGPATSANPPSCD